MTQYNSKNVNLSDSQLAELKPVTQIVTKVILKLSANMTHPANDASFLHKLLWTDTQV